MFCIWIDSKTIIPYMGEVLKMYVGRKLVKAIANPTDDDLISFGYLPYIPAEEPEYDETYQRLEYTYTLIDGKVIETVEVKETEEETEK